MNMLQNVKYLKDYDNKLIVYQHGQTLFFDMADLQVLTNLGYTMDQFVGRNITAVYDNLTLEDSTLITVLKTGKPMEHVYFEKFNVPNFRYTRGCERCD